MQCRLCGPVVLYMENKTGLYIIDSIPHCPSGKRICQNKQNQEMWLHRLIGPVLFSIYRTHTCDTFLNQNREIWNFWLGNLCLVSGGFHVANFGPFLPKLKSRNLVTFLEICYRASQCQHMPTEVRICVRLQFKKPQLILF